MLICIGGNIIINNHVSSSENYVESVLYNSARSQLFDWKTKDWSDTKDELESVGISENDFQSVKLSLLADTDIVTADTLSKIKEITQLSQQQKLSNIESEILGIWYTVNSEITLFFPMIMLIFLIPLLILFSSCYKNRLVELILSYLGAAIIILYFAGAGRIPLRIIQTVLLGCVLSFVLFCFLQRLDTK